MSMTKARLPESADHLCKGQASMVLTSTWLLKVSTIKNWHPGRKKCVGVKVGDNIFVYIWYLCVPIKGERGDKLVGHSHQ